MPWPGYGNSHHPTRLLLYSHILSHEVPWALSGGVVDIDAPCSTQHSIQSLILSTLITPESALTDSLHGKIPMSPAEYFVLAMLNICTIILQADMTYATTNSFSVHVHILGISQQWDHRLYHLCGRPLWFSTILLQVSVTVSSVSERQIFHIHWWVLKLVLHVCCEIGCYAHFHTRLCLNIYVLKV